MGNKEAQKRWREKHPDYHKNWRIKNRSKWLLYRRKWRGNIRLQVLQHYSGDIPSCQCCGENHMEFLVIDHKDGGGNKHRKLLGGAGNTIYIWLKQHNYPDGFRVLCANCNMARGFYGYCPHED